MISLQDLLILIGYLHRIHVLPAVHPANIMKLPLEHVTLAIQHAKNVQVQPTITVLAVIQEEVIHST